MHRKYIGTMNFDSEWNVIKIFKPFFDILTCFRAENLKNPKLRLRSVVAVVVFVVLWTNCVYFLLIDMWHCYEFKFDFKIIAFPFGLLINGTQLMVTLDSLRCSSEQIEGTIVTLAEIVRESE